MPANALPWLTRVAALLLLPSSLFAESAEPISNDWRVLDAAPPAINARPESSTDRPPLPSRAAAVLFWNDRALELCIKYRRNPLRVARALAVLHVAIDDAVAAAKKGDEQAQAIAAATAAGAVLDYLFPLETPGRFEAMAWAIYAEANAAPGARRETFGDARRMGQLAAEHAIAHALRDNSDLVWDPRERPAPAPGRWRAAPPLYAYDPLEPLAASWTTWVLKDGGEVQPPPPVAYDTPAYWLPFILTPPFPSYVSTHATLSGAAAEVLAAFFPQAAGPLQAAAEEAALSRLYGGIHFRSDNDAGLELGRRIGRLVVEHKYGQKAAPAKPAQ